MDPISKSALEARLLDYLRLVEQSGEELIVTDNDRPVLKIVPIQARRSAGDVFADVRGKVEYRDDLLAPTTREWPET